MAAPEEMTPEEKEQLRSIKKFINPLSFENGQINNDVSCSNYRGASRQDGAHWKRKDGASPNTRNDYSRNENKVALRKATKPSMTSNRFAVLYISDDNDDTVSL